MLDQLLQTPSRSAIAEAFPQIVGPQFSGMRLARLRTALRRHVEAGQVPGLVALVHHAGREHVETLGCTTAMRVDLPGITIALGIDRDDDRLRAKALRSRGD